MIFEEIELQDPSEYDKFLDEIYEQLRENNPDLFDKQKTKLPPPHILRDPTKTIWANFSKTCEMMKRDPDHVSKFFLSELGTIGSTDSSTGFSIKGIYVPKKIESLLRKYISVYIMCKSCKGTNTKIVRDQKTRIDVLECMSCFSKSYLENIEKGYRAVGRGERRKNR